MGETLLHRACIEGQLRRVQDLVRQVGQNPQREIIESWLPRGAVGPGNISFIACFQKETRCVASLLWVNALAKSGQEGTTDFWHPPSCSEPCSQALSVPRRWIVHGLGIYYDSIVSKALGGPGHILLFFFCHT